MFPPVSIYKSVVRMFTLFEIFQSGFRAHQSTETAIVKEVMNDLIAADHVLVSIWVLLDVSASFNRVVHSILLRRLEHAILA